jgi:1L-myo-inositol 1-phosphate cytidylyltransferase/CDP-L-myo-inositol myo-inositolphosphotransferase
VLETLAGAGIDDAVVVTGHRGEQVQRALGLHALGLSVACVENPNYLLKNGVSLLAAKAFVDQGCVLTMADHLYPPELVQRLLAAGVPAGACALGVDYDIPR